MSGYGSDHLGVGMPENMTGPPALVTAAHFATATPSDSVLVKTMRAAHAHISSAVKTKGDREITQHALLELELALSALGSCACSYPCAMPGSTAKAKRDCIRKRTKRDFAEQNLQVNELPLRRNMVGLGCSCLKLAVQGLRRKIDVLESRAKYAAEERAAGTNVESNADCFIEAPDGSWGDLVRGFLASEGAVMVRREGTAGARDKDSDELFCGTPHLDFNRDHYRLQITVLRITVSQSTPLLIWHMAPIMRSCVISLFEKSVCHAASSVARLATIPFTPSDLFMAGGWNGKMRASESAACFRTAAALTLVSSASTPDMSLLNALAGICAVRLPIIAPYPSSSPLSAGELVLAVLCGCVPWRSTSSVLSCCTRTENGAISLAGSCLRFFGVLGAVSNAFGFFVGTWDAMSGRGRGDPRRAHSSAVTNFAALTPAEHAQVSRKRPAGAPWIA